jgi:hypothetical protein
VRSSYLRVATVRRLELGTLIDTFLISAATCLLVIRAALAATGWPQLGNDTLHIAHMLWGGLGMLVGLFVVFIFSSRYALVVAAVVGGLGFGAFIDELGKFITSDNDYFFEPTIGLIYIIFIVLYLVARTLERALRPSQNTYIVNTVDLLKEAFIVGVTEKNRELARSYLARCDASDSSVAGLQRFLQELEPISPKAPGRLARAGASVQRAYGRLVRWRPFVWVMGGIVVVFVALNILWVIVLTLGWSKLGVEWADLSFGEAGQLVGAVLSGVLALAGAVIFWFTRTWGYRLLDYAVVVSIFVTQIFRFWQNELAAITGLAISLVLHLILVYAMERERRFVAEGREDKYASGERQEEPAA